jgi:peptidoglycan DL-endopeptidase CwlO
LRILARRLLPVFAFALVLSFVLAGLFSHSRSGLTLRSAAPAGVRQGDRTGVSSAVGAIPGVAGTRAASKTGSWPYALTVAAKPLPGSGPARKSVPKLIKLLQADVLIVAPATLSPAVTRGVRRLKGVVAAVPVDAGRIKVNGIFTNVLGVDPVTFRPFAAKPTAGSATLWNNIAAGGMAISYTMGTQDKLSLTTPVKIIGSRAMSLPVAGFGTVGIGGVDAVVSTRVGRSLGLPSDNAIVVSAPSARLDVLMGKIKKLLPASAAVTALVTQIIAGRSAVTTGSAGEVMTLGSGAAAQGPGLTSTELTKFLTAAMSRIGLPYVWGGDGPDVFDCSGLVQWSMAQAGVVMPRVAADQARTGPLLPLSELEPGDLLFYHTDPTAPDYISHVAIYIGNGEMLQAPEPGLDVEIVKADFGAGFAGAIRVYPKVAAAVAASIAG